MNPGLFKHKISFLQSTTVEDELEQQIESWQTVKTVWSAIKTMQGREYYEAAATQNENTVRFIIRYTSGIDPSMRIDFKGRTFEIKSVINDDEANKTLTIIAKERV
jgi:SPP1 family predicted phage head-tail adaptor